MSLSIRRYRETDWPELWPILQVTIQGGDTYAFAPDASESDMRTSWTRTPNATYVACAADGRIVGSYFIKTNQPGLGSHVCNCGYLVAPDARGQGIAAAMCEHSQTEALAMGYRAMQFNLVVATNEPAVHLWRKLGFDIVGTLPRAFRHRDRGFVDAHVMYKLLTED